MDITKTEKLTMTQLLRSLHEIKKQKDESIIRKEFLKKLKAEENKILDQCQVIEEAISKALSDKRVKYTQVNL